MDHDLNGGNYGENVSDDSSGEEVCKSQYSNVKKVSFNEHGLALTLSRRLSLD